MLDRTAFFLVNLVQDVNFVRPLALLTAQELGLKTALLVSQKFFRGDQSGRWIEEIAEISWQAPIEIYCYRFERDALRVMNGKAGVLVASSESSLAPHAETHNVFRAAPPGFFRITLQHGFEGAGLLHSREHDQVHGREVSFAADLICGWFGVQDQKSMLPSQRPKLYVTGPATLLHSKRDSRPAEADQTGIVCETLHSLRFASTSAAKGTFIRNFNELCEAQASEGKRVALRPHPAGQYVVKNKVELPANVDLVNDPIYKVDLSRYSYGISTASSVLIDMMLAGIPVAIWQDSSFDSSAFDGLATVTTAAEWLAFSREAAAYPEPFLERQEAFFARYGMPRDPDEVRRRFSDVLLTAAAADPAPIQGTKAKERVVLAIDGLDNVLESVFRDPFADLSANGELSWHALNPLEARKELGAKATLEAIDAWIETRLSDVAPTAMILSVKSGPYTDRMIGYALRHKLSIILYLEGKNEGSPTAQKLPNGAHFERILQFADVVCGTPWLIAAIRPRCEALAIATCEIAGWDGPQIQWFRAASDPRLLRRRQITAAIHTAKDRPKKKRVLLVCPGLLPTLQLSFMRPFALESAKQRIVYELITGEEIAALKNDKVHNGRERRWIAERIHAFAPDVIILCRYGGPHQDVFLTVARGAGIPVVYHIDDDLLNVPTALGEKKAAIHNHPQRVAAVRQGLDESTIVYCSTWRLKERLESYEVKAPVRAGAIYCSGRIIVPAELRPVRKFGYMASADHAHNLKTMLPALVKFLRRHKDIRFELFGSIPCPPALAEFGDRVGSAKPVKNYERFLEEFAKCEWDVGICPLSPIPFNLTKADTKLIEYTAVGAAVIATRGTVYDHFGTDDSCILAETVDEWLAALERLIDPTARYEQVMRAQARVAADYSIDRLLDQVLDVCEDARGRVPTNGAIPR